MLSAAAIGCEDAADPVTPVGVRYLSTGSSTEARFVTLAVTLDGGEHRIAAYQAELEVVAGRAEIVGVEGGGEPGFSEPPYYDPAALAGGRVILGAFDTKRALPTGRQRVAVVHLRETGTVPVEYALTNVVTASLNGETINARAYLSGQGGEER